VYLKRLELHGFKSFAPRTILEYSPGITAIVGPNGSGKCLVGASRVTLADGGELPIGQLVETALERASLVESLSDGALTRESPDNVRILSLDPVSLHLEIRPVAAFIRREAPPHLLRVRTRTGLQVVATPYHPFYTFTEGGLRTLRADELNPGVQLVVPRQGSISVTCDEIAEVERLIPDERWVYDLSIAGTHNFVAENLVVHNSNVADGIRWVLGEQSMRQLRGKKSDDVIFAGGQGRTTAQMAEVGLVLDNNNGWLPSEFSEVTVTRRSFRSGDSEYLVNGQRVRLKDVILLLAQARIGHDSYTVIGQGLVDQALSLRAEERRGLFEDAAGIRQFQVQRNEAEQRLNLTQGNLGRLYDIIGEIEPRLAPLAEQARRAEDWHATQTELSRLLRTWYAHQWQLVQSGRQEAEAREQSLVMHMERLRDALTVEDGLLEQLRQQRESVLAGSLLLRGEQSRAMNRLQTLERELAVAQERMASLGQQETDLQSEQEEQEEAESAARAHVGALEAQVERAEVEADKSREALESLERAFHTALQEQERQEARLRAAQRGAMQIQASLGAAQGEEARLQRQLSERNQVLAARNETVAQALHKVEVAQQQLEERQQLFEEARGAVESLVAQREELSREINAGQLAIEETRAAVADSKRERHSAADRLALLEEWRHTLLGADDGARALQNTEDSGIPPMLGSLSQMITVPEGFERAVEAAFGQLLHALVVRTRAEAEQGAEWLRRHQGGRAHFLWLVDEKATPEIADPTNFPEANNDETYGFVRDFVDCEDHIRPLIGRILGPTYLVRDLKVVVALKSIGSGSTSLLFPIVTLGGDFRHPSGWLRAGSGMNPDQNGQDGSTLAREREMRGLPAQLEQLDARISELSSRAEHALAGQEERRQRAEGLRKELTRTEELAQELAKSVTAMQREQERVQSELQVNTTVAEQLLGEIRDIEQEVSAAGGRVLEQKATQLAASAEVDDIQSEVDEILANNRGQQEALTAARTAAALHEQEVRALRQRAEQLQAQARELEMQVGRRRQRLEAIELQRQQLLKTSTERESERAALLSSVENLDQRLREGEREQSDLDRQLQELERAQNSERQELARVEGEYQHAIDGSQRARAAVEALKQQMREELGDAESEEGEEGEGGEGALQVEAEDEPDLSVEEATRLRRQIEALRGRMKHLGGYDPDAPHAYAELKIRFDFMSEQIQDMEQATGNLRSIIAELDSTMRHQFEETFRAVNERFQRHFQTLFSGGAARLELTAPKRQPADDDSDEALEGPVHAPKPAGLGGVEIFVQIPGKKVQDLSLLSGGERALVSAALLFALLESNPPPFCLLDEVDAALDEANVMRFCEILEQLSEHTQFIVITHNRVTMTHANAIYGISMGDDSVSRVLSMRLADVKVGG
jgi:chromosome segregation protein